MIFDDIQRIHVGPAAAGETNFGYLNRSSRPEAEKVRLLTDDWFSRYPNDHRVGLLARLQSPIDDVTTSAFFELAVHELLIRTGHSILEVEPKLPHTDRSPDFLLDAPNGQRFYLEAISTSGRSAADRAAIARLNAAIEEVERANAPNHFLDLEIAGRPDQPVSLRRLRAAIAGWLSAVPPDEQCSSNPLVYSEHGMTLTITAYRRRRPADPGARALGAQSMEPYWGTPGDGIREAVEKKASRYGQLDAPYIVAVNAMGEYQSEEDAVDALFGSPCVIVKTFDDGQIETSSSRNSDGVFLGPKGPRKPGVSAVLSTERLTPWSVDQRRARLIRNPWATHVLGEIPLRVDELNPIDGRLKKIAGESFGTIFGLPAGWPEVIEPTV